MDYTELRFAGSNEPVIPGKRQRFEFKVNETMGFGVTLNRLTHVEWATLAKKWTKPGGTGLDSIDQERCAQLLAQNVIDDIDGLTDQHGAKVVADQDIKVMLLKEFGSFFLFVLTRGQDTEAFRKKDASGPASSITGASPATSEPSNTAAA